MGSWSGCRLRKVSFPIAIYYYNRINVYNSAILFGAITAWWWKKYFGKNFDLYAFSVAAGLIAGEGLAGVINAALELGEVSGSFYGTSVALPGA